MANKCYIRRYILKSNGAPTGGADLFNHMVNSRHRRDVSADRTPRIFRRQRIPFRLDQKPANQDAVILGMLPNEDRWKK